MKSIWSSLDNGNDTTVETAIEMLSNTKAGEVTAVTVNSALVTKPSPGSVNPLTADKAAGKGKYAGTITRNFRIVPKQAAISSLTPGRNKLTVKASTNPSAKGASTYRIAYRQKGTRTWKYVSVTTQSGTIAKLKKSKCYYVKIRAVKTVIGVMNICI